MYPLVSIHLNAVLAKLILQLIPTVEAIQMHPNSCKLDSVCNSYAFGNNNFLFAFIVKRRINSCNRVFAIHVLIFLVAVDDIVIHIFAVNFGVELCRNIVRKMLELFDNNGNKIFDVLVKCLHRNERVSF